MHDARRRTRRRGRACIIRGWGGAWPIVVDVPRRRSMDDEEEGLGEEEQGQEVNPRPSRAPCLCGGGGRADSVSIE